jgi:hypothetical protein
VTLRTVTKSGAHLWNADLEVGVLGKLVAGGDGWVNRARDLGVHADAFYLPRHGVVFSALVALADRGDPIDSIALLGELESMGALDHAGGQETVLGHETNAGPVTNLDHHIKRLLDLAARRELDQLGDLAKHTSTNGCEPDQVRDIGARITRLADGSGHAGEASRCLTPFDVSAALRESPPAVDWVVDGYVQGGTVTLLHGDGGLGKSLLALLFARGVAGGTPILERDATQGPVVIIDGENHPDEIHRRLHAFEWIGAANHLEYVRAEKQFLDLPDAEATLMRQFAGARLAILDSQRACWPGDEKEAQEVRGLYMMLARIAERTGAAILVIHHDNRTGGYSGSSDLNAAVASRLHLRATNDGDAVELVHAKCRSGHRQPIITYQTRYIDARFEFKITNGSPIPDDAHKVAAWVKSRGSATTGDIHAHLRISDRTIRDWVNKGHLRRLGIHSNEGNHTPTHPQPSDVAGNTTIADPNHATKPKTTTPANPGKPPIATELAPATAGHGDRPYRGVPAPALTRPAPNAAENQPVAPGSNDTQKEFPC